MDKKNFKILTFGIFGGFVFGGYCTLKTCFKIKQIRQGFANAIADKFIDVVYKDGHRKGGYVSYSRLYEDRHHKEGKVSYSRFSETRR